MYAGIYKESEEMTREQCNKCGWLLPAENNTTGQDRCLLYRVNITGTMRTRRIEDIEECKNGKNN